MSPLASIYQQAKTESMPVKTPASSAPDLPRSVVQGSGTIDLDLFLSCKGWQAAASPSAQEGEKAGAGGEAE